MFVLVYFLVCFFVFACVCLAISLSLRGRLNKISELVCQVAERILRLPVVTCVAHPFDCDDKGIQQRFVSLPKLLHRSCHFLKGTRRRVPFSVKLCAGQEFQKYFAAFDDILKQVFQKRFKRTKRTS